MRKAGLNFSSLISWLGDYGRRPLDRTHCLWPTPAADREHSGAALSSSLAFGHVYLCLIGSDQSRKRIAEIVGLRLSHFAARRGHAAGSDRLSWGGPRSTKKPAGAGTAGRPSNSGTVTILPLKFAPSRQDRHPNVGVRRSLPASTTHCPDEKPPLRRRNELPAAAGREFVANLRSSCANPRRNRLTEAQSAKIPCQIPCQQGTRPTMAVSAALSRTAFGS